MDASPKIARLLLVESAKRSPDWGYRVLLGQNGGLKDIVVKKVYRFIILFLLLSYHS